MINIAICDDEKQDILKLKYILQGIMDKYCVNYDIQEYESGESLLQAVSFFHLIFLDIVMNGEDGIEVGKHMRRRNHSTKIIFQTNFGNYCKEAMNRTHAFAFLEKPLKSWAVEEQIKEMLSPLLPYQYINNPILDCLLSDKKRIADKHNIDFKIDLSDVDVNFIRPIDITTLFGNLIDNAITACRKCSENRYIGFIIKEHKEMISIRIENSIANGVCIKNGIIDVSKENNSCVGLLNIQKCVKTYMGDVMYKCSGQLLICDIVLNRIDD